MVPGWSLFWGTLGIKFQLLIVSDLGLQKEMSCFCSCHRKSISFFLFLPILCFVSFQKVKLRVKPKVLWGLISKKHIYFSHNPNSKRQNKKPKEKEANNKDDRNNMYLPFSPQHVGPVLLRKLQAGFPDGNAGSPAFPALTEDLLTYSLLRNLASGPRNSVGFQGR